MFITEFKEEQNLPFKAISLLDIQEVIPNFKLDWIEHYENDARVLFWNLGLNVEYGIEIQAEVLHRSKLCGVVKCPRVLGVERTDREWLHSGNASDEAVLHTKDWSLMQEIGKLGRR